MFLRILRMAGLVLVVMVVITVCLGPGVGVEANCVSLQTCGKTLVPLARDLALSLRLGWGEWGARG